MGLLTAFERKAVQAAAWSQQATGAVVGFHPGRSKESANEIMRIFQESGGKAQRAILCHAESKFWSFQSCSLGLRFCFQTFTGTFDSMEELCEFSKLGTIIQFDLFGFESYLEPFTFPNDAQRIDMIKHLIKEEDCMDKILASSDIHTKHGLVS